MICSRCLGTGNWINPKNPLDKRDCFACNGTGQATLRPRGGVRGVSPDGTGGQNDNTDLRRG